MNLLTASSEYPGRKGRLSSRSKESELPGLACAHPGIDKCLWVFPPLQWQEFSQKLMASTSLFQAVRGSSSEEYWPRPRKSRSIAWEISVPQSLREWAGLSRECVILGISKYIEIWNAEEYKKYLDENQGEFMNAAEELGGLTL